MIFELDSSIASFFPGKAEGFDAIMRLEGERYRHLDGRTTARVVIGGLAYFIKQHRGVGWREIFKNVVQGRLPIVGARNEVLALKRLTELGVPAPRVLGYGERGLNPATRESFIIMEALDDTLSLEILCADWANNPPAFAFKQAIITAIANTARVLHSNGMNHRDFYLCHFLLEKTSVGQWPVRLFLIDLHRAAIRNITPIRWVSKDLAGLYFSSKGMGFTARDYYRFIKAYRLQSLRDILKSESKYWEYIQSLGEKLYREHC